MQETSNFLQLTRGFCLLYPVRGAFISPAEGGRRHRPGASLVSKVYFEKASSRLVRNKHTALAPKVAPTMSIKGPPCMVRSSTAS